MKRLSKKARTFFVAFLFLYGLITFVTWWTYVPDYKKILSTLAFPTFALYLAYSALASGSFDGKKEMDELPKQGLYRRITKYTSIGLGSPLALFGLLSFIVGIIDKDSDTGIQSFIALGVLSIPLYALPWGVYFLWITLKRKDGEPS